MLKQMLASALFAGLAAGLFAAALQLALVVPLIEEAELFESGTLTHFAGADAATRSHGSEAPGTSHGAEPGDDHGAAGGDATRTLKTVMMTVLTTCGFGLVLVAGFGLAERLGLARIDLRSGLVFGLAGFAATQLMPSMGLAPELPGAAAGDLYARQFWWLVTVVCTLGGLAAIAWGNPVARVAGALLIAVPHLWGAPHPDGYAGVVPPELSALFAARVLAVGALGWAALGALAGHFWSREVRDA